MRLILALVMAGLYAVPVFAAPAEPIDIDAAKLEVNQKAGTAVFSGGVKVVQGAMTLTAPTLNAVYGGGGKTELKSLTATGGVTIVRGGPETETATGETAVYNPSAQTLTLSGGQVTLTRGGNTLSGSQLVYNMATGNAQLTANPATGRVKARFVPE